MDSSQRPIETRPGNVIVKHVYGDESSVSATTSNSDDNSDDNNEGLSILQWLWGIVWAWHFGRMYRSLASIYLRIVIVQTYIVLVLFLLMRITENESINPVQFLFTLVGSGGEERDSLQKTFLVLMAFDFLMALPMRTVIGIYNTCCGCCSEGECCINKDLKKKKKKTE